MPLLLEQLDKRVATDSARTAAKTGKEHPIRATMADRLQRTNVSWRKREAEMSARHWIQWRAKKFEQIGDSIV